MKKQPREELTPAVGRLTDGGTLRKLALPTHQAAGPEADSSPALQSLLEEITTKKQQGCERGRERKEKVRAQIPAPSLKSQL